MATKEEYQSKKGAPRKGGSYIKGKDGKEKLVARTQAPAPAKGNKATDNQKTAADSK